MSWNQDIAALAGALSPKEFVEKVKQILADEQEYYITPTVAQSKLFGDYFRDLSLNYHEYTHGILPWPERPAGLVLVEPIGDL